MKRKQRLEGQEGSGLQVSWGKNVLVKGSTKYKGPEAGTEQRQPGGQPGGWCGWAEGGIRTVRLLVPSAGEGHS